jgi:nitrate/nitrite transporter NarK
MAGPQRLTSRELKAALDQSALTKEERQQYQAKIFDSVTAADSISLTTVNIVFGLILVVAGLLATLFGGWLADKLRGRIRGAYFQVSGWSALVGFVPFVVMLYTPSPYSWGCVFLAIFFLFLNTGPANTILANVTRHRIRATAFAINILIIHALGDVISPPIIGLLADLSNLGTALLIVSFLILLAGVLWVMGARYLDAETARISEAENGMANAK